MITQGEIIKNALCGSQHVIDSVTHKFYYIAIDSIVRNIELEVRQESLHFFGQSHLIHPKSDQRVAEENNVVCSVVVRRNWQCSIIIQRITVLSSQIVGAMRYR